MKRGCIKIKIIKKAEKKTVAEKKGSGKHQPQDENKVRPKDERRLLHDVDYYFKFKRRDGVYEIRAKEDQHFTGDKTYSIQIEEMCLPYPTVVDGFLFPEELAIDSKRFRSNKKLHIPFDEVTLHWISCEWTM